MTSIAVESGQKEPQPSLLAGLCTAVHQTMVAIVRGATDELPYTWSDEPAFGLGWNQSREASATEWKRETSNPSISEWRNPPVASLLNAVHPPGAKPNPLLCTLCFGVMRVGGSTATDKKANPPPDGTEQNSTSGAQYCALYNAAFQDRGAWLAAMMPFLDVEQFRNQEADFEDLIIGMQLGLVGSRVAIRDWWVPQVGRGSGCTVEAFKCFEDDAELRIWIPDDGQYKYLSRDVWAFDRLIGMRAVAYMRLLDGLLCVFSSPIENHFKTFSRYFTSLADTVRNRLAQSEFGRLLSEQAAICASVAREPMAAQARIERREPGRYDYTAIVGASEGMRRVFQKLDRIIESDITVLIQGESGTGKELIARAIHFNGPRKSKPFVTENCAALPDSLLESELFGHVPGAFTGARRGKKGLFEQADGGTLFLDEIGDMSPEMQKKVLRVLQEGEFRPVGSEEKIKVDVRLIAASHQRLDEMVAAGAFREDLYYRVHVLTVDLPPLRERREDIPLLAEALLARAAREAGRAVPQLPREVLAALVAYDWPGNVRELENEMRRLVVLAADEVRLEHLSSAVLERRVLRAPSTAGSAQLSEAGAEDQEAKPKDDTSGAQTGESSGWSQEALDDGNPRNVAEMIMERLPQSLEQDDLVDKLRTAIEFVKRRVRKFNPPSNTHPWARAVALAIVNELVQRRNMTSQDAAQALVLAATRAGWPVTWELEGHRYSSTSKSRKRPEQRAPRETD